MNKYPQLAKMGVSQPKQIERYSVNSIAYTDILRIDYERPSGSILPCSKTFKFPRIQTTVPAGDGANGERTAMVSSPELRAAVDELKAILGSKAQIEDVAGAVLNELRLLEEDIASRSDYIKELLTKIPDV